jgi:hypothetical protein
MLYRELDDALGLSAMAGEKNLSALADLSHRLCSWSSSA